MSELFSAELIERLNELGPKELLEWAYKEHGDRAAIITSFQETGLVTVDMAHEVAPKLRVVTMDTLRLHDETYAHMDTVEIRYDLTIERFTPDPQRLEAMVKRHGEFLFFDNKAKQEYCCKIRKVEPNHRALASIDVWFTGLRRDQSEFRKDAPKVSLLQQEDRGPILKIAPLVDWTEDEIDVYLDERDIARNVLSSQGYTSIGCKICTTPTLPGEEKRSGRWRWFNCLGASANKECGIHMNGGGI
jgi:phosphoadenosine phosphosulfate reductase